MGKIVVIGLGPGDAGQLTLKAAERLGEGNPVFLRTERHPAVSYLKKKKIAFNSYDYIYEEKEDFQQIYKFITKDLVKKSEKYGIINYCVPGNPFVAENTVSRLVDLHKEGKIELEIITGISFIESVISNLGVDTSKGLKVIDSVSLGKQAADINVDNIIAQIYNSKIASYVKLNLMEIYNDDYEICIIRVSESNNNNKATKIPLYELDRLKTYDYQTYLYIPKIDNRVKNRYNMNNLTNIMEKLRSKKGCPWDIKQTHQSLREYVLEEAYEVVDAIDNGNIDSLVEELGDLLLQIVFHSQIGREEGYFNIWDVITGISDKLVYRHPHVFGEEEASDLKEAKYNWDQMKNKEKNIGSYTEKLRNVPKGISALMKSYKIQERAADVGFDWDDVNGPLEKVKEELNEVLEEFYSDNKENTEEEFGDLLFAVVNLSRFMGINPEVSLNRANNKFTQRFEYIENESNRRGKDLVNMEIEEMNELWNLAKAHKNKKKDKK